MLNVASPAKVSRDSSPERLPVPQPEQVENKISSAHVSPGGSPRKIEDHTDTPEKSIPKKKGGVDQPALEERKDLKDRDVAIISGDSDSKLADLKVKYDDVATSLKQTQTKLTAAETTVKELTAKLEAAPQATAEEIQEKQNAEVVLKEAEVNVKRLEEQVSSLQSEKRKLEEQVKLHHEAVKGLRAQQKQLTAELQKAQVDAETAANEFKQKLDQAQKTGEKLDELRAHASDIATGTFAAALGAKNVLELLAGKLQKASQTKDEIAKDRAALELKGQDLVSREEAYVLGLGKLETFNQELQERQDQIEQAEKELQERISGAGKFKETKLDGVLAPSAKIKLADIKPGGADAMQKNALQYIFNKLYSNEKLEAFKAEYEKIADPKFPGVTKESFARFLAGEVSRAFGRAEYALLSTVPAEEFKTGTEKVIFENVKKAVLEQISTSGIPGVHHQQEAQFIAFVNAAIKALENPVKLLKEAPDHSWRNLILRNLSVDLLGSVGAFVYRGPIEGVIFSNLPKEGLDLVAAISSTGSELYQSAIELGLPRLIVDCVSEFTKYTGDPTVPLLCTVLVAVFYFIFDLIVSRLLRQKAKTEDEVIQGLIAKNVQLVRV